MGHGIKYLKITTDPVELWAAPNSRSRIEKDFFDKNFEPFYRIEQVSEKSASNSSIKVLIIFFFKLFRLFSRRIIQISHMKHRMDPSNLDLHSTKNFCLRFMNCKIISKVSKNQKQVLNIKRLSFTRLNGF